MEAVGATSSIIAIVDLSVKVIKLCSDYYQAVSGARDSITLLDRHIKSLEVTLHHAQNVVGNSETSSLPASHNLIDQLQQCQAELQGLLVRLEPNLDRKAMRRFGARALKWPFRSGEIEAITSNLERYQNSVMRGLQIDQT
jgi:hypothetical protein